MISHNHYFIDHPSLKVSRQGLQKVLNPEKVFHTCFRVIWQSCG